MNEKQQALIVYIMIVSALRLVDNPTKKVSDLSRQIIKGLKKTYLKTVVGQIARIQAPEYKEANDKVIEAWDTARRELITPDGELDSSMGEMIQHLWNRLNKNKYQTLYTSERRVMMAINSFKGHLSNTNRTEDEELIAMNNSRRLAEKFCELCNLPKQHNLATRMRIQRENLILEGKKVA